MPVIAGDILPRNHYIFVVRITHLVSMTTGAVPVPQPASGAPVAMVTNGGGDGPVPGGATGTGAAATQQTNQQLANTKEKTPMCLVNELARFNKIQHQVSGME